MDVSERHPGAGLHKQLPHGALAHQETAPYNQRNCLDGEGQSELAVAETESNLFGQEDCRHLNSAKIDQRVQADQLLDLFHSPHSSVAADHNLSESIRASHSAPRRRRLAAGKETTSWMASMALARFPVASDPGAVSFRIFWNEIKTPLLPLWSHPSCL